MPHALPSANALAVSQYIQALPPAEQRALGRLLRPWFASVRPRRAAAGPSLTEVREARFREGLRCPRCRATDSQRWGRYKNRQRYRCAGCRRTFNDLTGTRIAYAKRLRLWSGMAQCHLLGLPMRKTARRLRVLTSTTTFRWRHRLMDAIRQLPPEVLAGIMEADETFFRYSEKGKRNLDWKPRKRGGPAARPGLSREQVGVVAARDRQAGTVAAVAARGAPTTQNLTRVLQPCVPAGSTPCTDGADAYRRFCVGSGVVHQPVGNAPGTRVVGGIYDIQHINAYHQRLKQWMRRFSGVATKYLDSHMRWHVFLEPTKGFGRRAECARLLLDTCAA
jgi:transposase-like protein